MKKSILQYPLYMGQCWYRARSEQAERAHSHPRHLHHAVIMSMGVLATRSIIRSGPRMSMNLLTRLVLSCLMTQPPMRTSQQDQKNQHESQSSVLISAMRSSFWSSMCTHTLYILSLSPSILVKHCCIPCASLVRMASISQSGSTFPAFRSCTRQSCRMFLSSCFVRGVCMIVMKGSSTVALPSRLQFSQSLVS